MGENQNVVIIQFLTWKKIISRKNKSFFSLHINHNKCQNNDKWDEKVCLHLEFQYSLN